LTEKSTLQAAADSEEVEEVEEVEPDSGGADVGSEGGPVGSGTSGGGTGAGGSGRGTGIGTIGMTLAVVSQEPAAEQDRVAVVTAGVQVWPPAQLNDCTTVVEEHGPLGQLNRNVFGSGSQLVPAGQMNSAGLIEVGAMRVPPVTVTVTISQTGIHTVVKYTQRVCPFVSMGGDGSPLPTGSAVMVAVVTEGEDCRGKIWKACRHQANTRTVRPTKLRSRMMQVVGYLEGTM
jgi:hypothetical protein